MVMPEPTSPPPEAESQNNESQNNESQSNESQSNESQSNESQSNESQSNESQSNESKVTLKLLIPHYVAGCIIGKGGDQIKELKESTNALIKVSRLHEYFPGTEERIILVMGELDSAMEAVSFIHKKIRDKTPPPVRRYNGSRYSKRRLEQMKMIVADTSAGKIIGKKGLTVKTIQQECNVKVFLTSKDDWGVVPGERVATISGEEDEVNSAIRQILCKIQEDPYARLNKSLAYPRLPDYYWGGPPDHRPWHPPPHPRRREEHHEGYQGPNDNGYPGPPPHREGGYQPPHENGYQSMGGRGRGEMRLRGRGGRY